ncbi:hypothetical protein [Chryseobacterium sp. Alg-005]
MLVENKVILELKSVRKP